MIAHIIPTITTIPAWCIISFLWSLNITVVYLPHSLQGHRPGWMRTTVGKGTWWDWRGREATNDRLPRPVLSHNPLKPNSHYSLFWLCPFEQSRLSHFTMETVAGNLPPRSHNLSTKSCRQSFLLSLLTPLPIVDSDQWHRPLWWSQKPGNLQLHCHCYRHRPGYPLPWAVSMWPQNMSQLMFKPILLCLAGEETDQACLLLFKLYTLSIHNPGAKQLLWQM